jgi:phosphate transport system permease protein
MNPIYRSRRRNDIIVRLLCLGAALFGVTWLALILFTLFYNGLAGISLQIFTENTPPPGSTEGGLLNAIIGSIIMTVIGVGVGAPLGLFAGTYLAEYGRNDRLTAVIRFINDILLVLRRSSSACSSMAPSWCRCTVSRPWPAAWRWL